MPALEDPRHEEFCLRVVSGYSATRAYREAMYSKDTPGAGTGASAASTPTSTASAAACRLMARPEIRERIAEMRAGASRLAEEVYGLTKETLIRSHLEIIETPLSEIDDQHPLCQELQRSRVVVGKGQEATPWVVEKVKMPSKTDSMKELAKLSGFYEPQRVEFTGPASWDQFERLALGSSSFGDEVIRLADRIKASRNTVSADSGGGA